MSPPLRYSHAMRISALAVALLFCACSSKTVVDAGAPPVKETPAVKETPVEPAPGKAGVLEVTLTGGDAHLAGKPIKLRMRVKNPTGAPLRFCRYHTLFEGLRNDIFDVKRADGSELEYRGMMAKRAPPGPEDYVTVAPGEEVVSDEVDVSEGYPFTAGTHSIVFPGGGISGLPPSAPLDIDVK